MRSCRLMLMQAPTEASAGVIHSGGVVLVGWGGAVGAPVGAAEVPEVPDVPEVSGGHGILLADDVGAGAVADVTGAGLLASEPVVGGTLTDGALASGPDPAGPAPEQATKVPAQTAAAAARRSLVRAWRDILPPWKGHLEAPSRRSALWRDSHPLTPSGV